MKNMTDLRSKLIRLAHEKPELRSRLLPILAKSAAQTYDEYVRDWKKLKYPVKVKGELLPEERWKKLMLPEKKSAAKDSAPSKIVTTYRDSAGKEKTSTDSWLAKWGKPTKANFEKIVSKGFEDKSLGTPVEAKLVSPTSETLFTYKPKTAAASRQEKTSAWPPPKLNSTLAKAVAKTVDKHWAVHVKSLDDIRAAIGKGVMSSLPIRDQVSYQGDVKTWMASLKKPELVEMFRTIEKIKNGNSATTYTMTEDAAQALRAASDKEAIRGPFSMPRSSYIPKDEPTLQQRKNTPEGLEIWTWEGYSRGQDRVVPYAIAFAGKADKPLWHHSFRDVNGQERMIQETIKNQESRIKQKLDRREEKKNFQHGLQIGDILYASWGYDQTNIDFYEVTKLYDKAVGVREIGKKSISEGQGSDKVVAAPGKFIGPEVKKIPQGSGGHVYLRISDVQSASKWDGRPLHETSSGWGH